MKLLILLPIFCIAKVFAFKNEAFEDETTNVFTDENSIKNQSDISQKNLSQEIKIDESVKKLASTTVR